MAAIEIAGVVKAFGTTPVIHGIDLIVQDGEFVVLVGPSGCGKSTLLRMIAGLESVSGGKISIGGKVMNDLAPRDRNIAMVFQDYALYPHKSVGENIGFGLKMRGADALTIDKKVQEAAHILQIGHLLDRKPGQLSGGQRQRVAMGRAIVRDPQVFLFDEPLSNLDAQLRAEMRVEIKKLHQRFGTTILYVTHDQVEAMTLADRIAILKGGNLEQYDSPDQLYNSPVSTFVASFIGSPSMNIVPVTISSDGDLVTLPGGARCALPAEARPRFAKAAGQSVLMGLRPEHVTFTPDSPITTRIEIIEPLGSDTLAMLRLGEGMITGRFAPETSLKTGNQIPIGFNFARAHLFDSKTTRSLA